jgi:hypothetical protein
MDEPSRSAPDPRRATLFGVLLFLFIPLVLYLFVAHPAPIALSVLAGGGLMAVHRLLARPYMLAVRPHKCVWCNRFFSGSEPGASAVDLEAGTGPALALLACPAHVEPSRRYFAFLDRFRLPLRLGIGLPLGVLLGSLVALALGSLDWTPPATQFFRLAVGLTVNVAALGPWLGASRERSRTAFPVHNFYLLGVRNILWIFRLVGLYWIFAGARYFLDRLPL